MPQTTPVGQRNIATLIGASEYKPKSNVDQAISPSKVSDNPNSIHQFRDENPTAKEIRKNMEGMRTVMITYAKNRVPLGEDKFNSSDMFRNIIDMLKASENMHLVMMQQQQNELSQQQLYVDMNKNISDHGFDGLIADESIDFDGENATKFALMVPKDISALEIIVGNEAGRAVNSYVIENPTHGLLEKQWDGLNDENEKVSAGKYRVHAHYRDQDDDLVPIEVYTRNVVDELRYLDLDKGGQPVYYSKGKPVKNIIATYAKNAVTTRG